MIDGLYLVRHGESMGNVWPRAYENDNKNFLTSFGLRQAELTGAYFKRVGINFDLVVSSDMTRARQTMATILHELGWQRDWLVLPTLNEVRTSSDRATVRHAFRSLRSTFEAMQGNVLIVSHGHTMQVLFDELTDGDRDGVDSLGGRYVGNAAVFVWYPTDPKLVDLLDLTDVGPQN